jgi:hypothetical protein
VRSAVTHRLKSWPDGFRDVLTGRKRFEVRRDDRGFQPGDQVELLEFDPSPSEEGGPMHGYTGRAAMYKIGYVQRGAPSPDGWCAFDLVSPEDCSRAALALLGVAS